MNQEERNSLLVLAQTLDDVAATLYASDPEDAEEEIDEATTAITDIASAIRDLASKEVNGNG